MGVSAESWGVGIAGVGAYLPERVVTNDELEARLGLAAGWIVERTGILQRHAAAPEQATSDLAAVAARRALTAAGVDAAELSMVILATCTPDETSPATACRLQHLIGATRAVAFDVMAACSGFLFALHTAAAALSRSSAGPILVVGSEAFSRFLDPTDRGTAILFGDGAAAAVVAPCQRGGIERLSLGSDGSRADDVHIPGGSRRPAHASTGTDRVHYVTMHSAEVRHFVRGQLGAMLAGELRAAGVAAEAVAKLVPHQPNPKFVRELAAEAGFAGDRMVLTADRVGNLGAAGVPYSLAQAVATGAVREGDLLLLAALGAGVTWASGLLTWGAAPAVVGDAESRQLAGAAA